MVCHHQDTGWLPVHLPAYSLHGPHKGSSCSQKHQHHTKTWSDCMLQHNVTVYQLFPEVCTQSARKCWTGDDALFWWLRLFISKSVTRHLPEHLLKRRCKNDSAGKPGQTLLVLTCAPAIKGVSKKRGCAEGQSLNSRSWWVTLLESFTLQSHTLTLWHSYSAIESTLNFSRHRISHIDKCVDVSKCRQDPVTNLCAGERPLCPPSRSHHKHKVDSCSGLQMTCWVLG